MRHLCGVESTSAKGRLVAVPRSRQQHIVRRGAVPIEDQIPSGEVTANEGVVLKAGAELIAAASVEGAADLGRALPHERREVADRPGWGFGFGFGFGFAVVTKAAWAAPAVDAAVRLPVVVSHLIVPILHGYFPRVHRLVEGAVGRRAVPGEVLTWLGRGLGLGLGLELLLWLGLGLGFMPGEVLTRTLRRAGVARRAKGSTLLRLLRKRRVVGEWRGAVLGSQLVVLVNVRGHES